MLGVVAQVLLSTAEAGKAFILRARAPILPGVIEPIGSGAAGMVMSA